MNYDKIYYSLIDRAKTRNIEGYLEKHHIIPRCIGGSDDVENLVLLTPEEHFLCHVLLVKMYPNNGKLIYAVNSMCYGHTGLRSNKMYGWLKRKYSEQRKIDTLGSKNPNYGKIWISMINGNKNKTILSCESVPDGWVVGRNVTYRECMLCKSLTRNRMFCSVKCKANTGKTKNKKNKNDIKILLDIFIEDKLSLRQLSENYNCSRNINLQFKKYFPSEYKQELLKRNTRQ